MPLEQVLRKKYQSYEIDIWSAGAIFLEFLTSKHVLFKNLRFLKEFQKEPVEYATSLVYELASIYGTKEVKEILEVCGNYPWKVFY